MSCVAGKGGRRRTSNLVRFLFCGVLQKVGKTVFCKGKGCDFLIIILVIAKVDKLRLRFFGLRFTFNLFPGKARFSLIFVFYIFHFFHYLFACLMICSFLFVGCLRSEFLINSTTKAL